MLRAFALLLLAVPVLAQVAPPERAFYVVPRVGLSHYVGDLDADADFDAWRDGGVPFYAGLEVGRQVRPWLAFGVSAGVMNLPTAAGPDVPAGYPGLPPGRAGFSARRLAYPFAVVARLQAAQRVAPYVEAGVGGALATFRRTSGTEATGLALGPQIGAGVDVRLSPHVALTLGVSGLFAFPDHVLDSDAWQRSRFGSAGSGGLVGEVAAFDWAASAFVGVRTYFGGARTPAALVATSGPAQLRVGEAGTYNATLTAAEGAEARWSFGDGATASGLEAEHRFATPGTYTVRLTVGRGRWQAEDSVVTHVVADPPVLVAASADPSPSKPGEAVTFSATATGSGPLVYRWTFGDGGEATGAQVSHTYARAGTYAVDLHVEGAGGAAQRSLTHEVAPDACAKIVELNTVFFAHASAALSEEARRALGENADVLKLCPNAAVAVEGFASPYEDAAESLSRARVEAVRAVYTAAGIAPERFTTCSTVADLAGLNRKDDQGRFRRVDSRLILE